MRGPPWKSSKGGDAGRQGEVIGFRLWVCFSSSISMHKQAIGVTPLNLETLSQIIKK